MLIFVLYLTIIQKELHFDRCNLDVSLIPKPLTDHNENINNNIETSNGNLNNSNTQTESSFDMESDTSSHPFTQFPDSDGGSLPESPRYGTQSQIQVHEPLFEQTLNEVPEEGKEKTKEALGLQENSYPPFFPKTESTRLSPFQMNPVISFSSYS